MSLAVIPNQPVAFGDTRLQGCLCTDPDDTLLIASGDTILFQFGQNTCETDGLITDPSFFDPSLWQRWVVGDGSACYDPTRDSTMTYPSFAPVVGTLYSIVVTCTSFAGSGSVQVRLGGDGGFFTGPGTFYFTADPMSADPLRIIAGGDVSACCLSLVQIYEQTTDIEVNIVNSIGVEVDTFNYTTDPTYFSYEGQFLTVEIPYDEAWGQCFTVEVYDPCDTATYTSQNFAFTDETCTLQLKACNASDGMGFGYGFAPLMRVRAKLTRPSYSYEEQVEKGTNGYINNFYVERSLTMELRVDRVGYFAHAFLSSLPLWDHVYVEQIEYRVKADAYEPAYGDVWESYGGILMTVEPKQDTLRKVRCGPDETMGCAPPPNFLVQRVGPNNDYILLQDGGRIQLHN